MPECGLILKKLRSLHFEQLFIEMNLLLNNAFRNYYILSMLQQ